MDDKIQFINIADVVNPDSGKTYREENMEKVHNIPCGVMVEVKMENPKHSGLRLWVVAQERDCDGTPLYALSFDKDWEPEMYGEQFKFSARFRIDGGYPEDCLTIIQ